MFYFNDWGEIMEDKKAKFIVYVVIALIAFSCSSAVYSMTGGLSDWIVSGMNNNEDLNNNGYLDSSENGGIFSVFGSDNGYDDGNYYDDNEPGIIDKIYNKLFNSEDYYYDSSYYSSSSDDNPDILARLLRMFISNG